MSSYIKTYVKDGYKRKDLIVGIAGGVILIVALLGIIFYQDDGAAAYGGLNVYEAKWNEETVTHTFVGESLSEKASADHPFTVPANAARVECTLSWTDDESTVSSADSFKFDLVDNVAATAASDEKNSGEIILFSQILDSTPGLPKGGAVVAETEGDARDAVLAANSSTVGMGNWRCKVTLSSVGNLPMLPVDTGNDYALTVKVVYYTLSVTEVHGTSEPSA